VGVVEIPGGAGGIRTWAGSRTLEGTGFAFEARDLGAEPVVFGLDLPDQGGAGLHTSQRSVVEVPGLLTREGVRVQVAERGELLFDGHPLGESGFPS
jgi:hypothetical protein